MILISRNRDWKQISEHKANDTHTHKICLIFADEGVKRQEEREQPGQGVYEFYDVLELLFILADRQAGR